MADDPNDLDKDPHNRDEDPRDGIDGPADQDEQPDPRRAATQQDFGRELTRARQRRPAFGEPCGRQPCRPDSNSRENTPRPPWAWPSLADSRGRFAC